MVRPKRRGDGFTLIEILIVIAIVGLAGQSLDPRHPGLPRNGAARSVPTISGSTALLLPTSRRCERRFPPPSRSA